MSKERKEKKIQETDQAYQAAAHKDAFNAVLDIINKHIIKKNEVMKVSSLKLTYINILEEKGYPSPEFHSDKLISRLQNHEISQSISFTKINPGDEGARSYFLIYNNKTTVAEALGVAYKLGSTDKFSDVALDLHKQILEAYKNSKKLPWPPTHDDMEIKSKDLLPEKLINFLNLVLTGTLEVEERSLRTQRLVLSIGQDLCRAVTKEE